jgi:hypothetical protein
MNDENSESSNFRTTNRIEKPDTKIEKNGQKSKSIFLTFFGSVVLAGVVSLFFQK